MVAFVFENVAGILFFGNIKKIIRANSQLVRMSTDLNALGGNKLRNVVTGESVEMKSFWQEQDTAVFFLRRWGCVFCRLWAKEISEIAPILKQNNIRLIGVGVEEVGAKEFVDGKFFDGELYAVEDRSTYRDLGFKRFSTFSVLTSLLWKESRNAISKGNRMHLGGDLKGDWVQIGGAVFVQKGGNLLKHFVQVGPAEHMSNEDILKVFKLENEYKPKEKSGDTATMCAWPWLFEPTMSYREICTTAGHSLASAWGDRACRRLAVMSQPKLLSPPKKKSPQPPESKLFVVL